MGNKLTLTLVENAEDFLLEAVRYAKASTARDWKYAILHLWSAMELLLKVLLEKEHWTLLFEDVNKASRVKLQAGDFQHALGTGHLRRWKALFLLNVVSNSC